MKWSFFLCFEFLTTKIIKHLTIWFSQLHTQTRRYGRRNLKYLRSAVLELLLHPGLCTQKGNKFPKIGSSTKFYVKNSSDITKRRSSWDKQEERSAVKKEEGPLQISIYNNRASECSFSFVIVHYFYNKSEDISWRIFN